MGTTERQSFAPGATIFREGEPGDCAYVIEQGRVQISALKDGHSLELAQLERHDLFGEMALIDDAHRTASATAVDDVEVWCIPRGYFRARFSESDPIINLFLRVVLERFRGTHEVRLRGEERVSEAPSSGNFERGRAAALREIEFRHELERALRNDELELHYQPIVGLDDARVVGFEALMRWNHPERGRIPPGEFIGFAERSGLIVPMGLWALRTAIAASAGIGELVDSPFISVNLSGRQLREGPDLDDLANCIRDAPIDNQRIKLEVTEGLLMTDPQQATNALTRLKSLGVGIAIDDFGIGYSSLGYLQRFPLDTLKIDRAFVSRMCGDARSMKIVRAIAHLARDLELDIVAEGVEHADERQTLVDLGCQCGQGYLFSKPLALDELHGWLEAR